MPLSPPVDLALVIVVILLYVASRLNSIKINKWLVKTLFLLSFPQSSEGAFGRRKKAQKITLLRLIHGGEPPSGNQDNPRTPEKANFLEGPEHPSFSNPLFELLRIAIWRKDLDGRFTFVNNSLCARAKKSSREIIGRTDFDLFPPFLAEKYRSDDQRVLETRASWEAIEQYVAPGEAVTRIRTVKMPLYEGDGKLVGTLGAFIELEKEQSSFDGRNHTQETAASAKAELEQLLNIVTHDLQEPVRIIKLYSELLQSRGNKVVDSEAHVFLKNISDGALRIRRLLNGLLAYHEMAQKELEFSVVDCSGIFCESVAGLKKVITEASAKITSGTLPLVTGDARLLRELFRHLIENAIKFRHEGVACLHVTAELKGSEWVFSFVDRGIGIDPRYQDRLFSIFGRLHSDDESGGVGIGLAICKRIVERHGGKIWVDSEPKKGTTFFFTIPSTTP